MPTLFIPPAAASEAAQVRSAVLSALAVFVGLSFTFLFLFLFLFVCLFGKGAHTPWGTESG